MRARPGCVGQGCDLAVTFKRYLNQSHGVFVLSPGPKYLPCPCTECGRAHDHHDPGQSWSIDGFDLDLYQFDAIEEFFFCFGSVRD